MWRKVYRGMMVLGTGVLILSALNDPKINMLWGYLTASQHAPIEYLIIWTFTLTVLNAAGAALGSRDEAVKEAQREIGYKLFEMEKDIARLQEALLRQHDRTQEALAKVVRAVGGSGVY